MKKFLLLFFTANLLCAVQTPVACQTPQKETSSLLKLPMQKNAAYQAIIDSIKNGFFTENGQTRYYEHGEAHIGFLELDGEKYYFDADGNMETGYAKIGDSWYYFDSDGKLQTGLIEVNSKKYGFDEKTGKKLFGRHKIGRYYYLFNEKTGEMTTGFQSEKEENSITRTYYNKKGRLQTGDFQVANAAYKADEENGHIYSVKNLTETVCQRPELPTGCEITSWTMMANYAGVSINKIRAANIMPTNSDPNQGFGGSPYDSSGGSQVIYPDGLREMTEKYLDGYINMTQCSLDELREKLWEKHLILIWVAGLDGFNSHTVALTGYDADGFFFNDPWTGEESRLSNEEFTNIWRGNGCRAMSY